MSFLLGVEISGKPRVILEPMKGVSGHPAVMADLLLVVMNGGAVSDGYCFLDSKHLGCFVTLEAQGGTRRFEVMTVREYLDRRAERGCLERL